MDTENGHIIIQSPKEGGHPNEGRVLGRAVYLGTRNREKSWDDINNEARTLTVEESASAVRGLVHMVQHNSGDFPSGQTAVFLEELGYKALGLKPQPRE
jgi:hypothetical protein